MALVLEGVVLRGRRAGRGAVAVEGGVVVAGAAAGARRALPRGWIVAPGLVDLQVNGFGGAEVGEDPGALVEVATALPRAGVTAFCPTLVSRPADGYRPAARALARARPGPAAARILPPHLEGPFLAHAHAGAHDPAALRDPSPAELDALLATLSPAILTLAPELPGALDAVRRAARRCVVSVGHTGAGAETGRAAIAAGATMITHALNAMRGIESRAPSALVAFLADPRPAISLIGDGLHVATEVATVLARAAARRLVLVSDASAPAGAPPGRYRLGGREVVSDGRRVTAGGVLAGSAVGLDRGPATLVAGGIGRAAALAAATEAPRRVLGLPAGLAPGGPADLVVLDGALVPRLTLVGGRVAYADPALPFDVPEPGAAV
jgi:N-acetylglucosamine-6-phosphate deacetylase